MAKGQDKYYWRQYRVKRRAERLENARQESPEQIAERRRSQRRAAQKRYRDRHRDARRAGRRIAAMAPEKLLEHRRVANAYMRAWYRRADNSKKVIAYQRAYYHKNKAEIAPKSRAQRLKKQYGLTVSQWESILQNQGGSCAICHTDKPATRLHVDHCHVTGRIRGILCASCNRCLGWLEKHKVVAEAYLSNTHELF